MLFRKGKLEMMHWPVGIASLLVGPNLTPRYNYYYSLNITIRKTITFKLCPILILIFTSYGVLIRAWSIYSLLLVESRPESFSQSESFLEAIAYTFRLQATASNVES